MSLSRRPHSYSTGAGILFILIVVPVSFGLLVCKRLERNINVVLSKSWIEPAVKEGNSENLAQLMNSDLGLVAVQGIEDEVYIAPYRLIAWRRVA